MAEPITLSFDRIEGRARDVAVLVTDAGDTVSLPRALLPADARPGVVLTLRLEIDHAATQALAADSKAVNERLTSRDPGGDVSL